MLPFSPYCPTIRLVYLDAEQLVYLDTEQFGGLGRKFTPQRLHRRGIYKQEMHIFSFLSIWFFKSDSRNLKDFMTVFVQKKLKTY